MECYFTMFRVSWDFVMLQNKTANAPFSADVWQGCLIESSIPTLSSRDKLKMNQPINVKESSWHGLDMEFVTPLFDRRNDAVCHFVPR